jgi:nucleotide-binding universal stress UspA family protein
MGGSDRATMPRMLPKVILVPVDFSVSAEQALDHACALASKLDAKVHLVHALVSPPSVLQVALTEDIIENLVKGHVEALETLVRARQGTASFGEVTVEVGDPRDTIVATAKTIDADLIVMGTHGRRGLSRVVMGSVAEDVMRNAPCPVLVVREKRAGG